MEDEELDSLFSTFDHPDCSMTMTDLFNKDQLLEGATACTHTHQCNQNGPDSSHTHTCFHFHTKFLPAATSEYNAPTDEIPEAEAAVAEKKPKKRLSGNTEAVRKYRMKQKAKANSMEQELAESKALNQRLMKALQSLKRENDMCKYLLTDIRGRIDGALGHVSYDQELTNITWGVCQNLATSNLPQASLMNPCNLLQCHDQLCPLPEPEAAPAEMGADFKMDEFDNLQCLEGFHNIPSCFRGCP